MNYTEKFKKYAGDGDSWGTFDFYSGFEELLDAALRSKEDFDTGYKGVRKESMSFRVTKNGNTATCFVNVSDEFNTVGRGMVLVELRGQLDQAERIDQVREGLTKAAGLANKDQEANRVYAGFSVGTQLSTGGPCWEYTLVLARDGEYDSPTGDNYDWWGWDDVVPEEEIASFGAEAEEEVRADNAKALQEFPQADRDAFEKWAWEWLYADDNAKPEPLTLNGNTIRPW